jgi:HSP20 family protein
MNDRDLIKKQDDRREITARRMDERSERKVAPPIDIFETDERVVVLADMPGVDRSELDITVDRGLLTVRGKQRQQTREGLNPIYQEYSPSIFERSFTLSELVDAENVSANVRDGVLRLEIPKRREARPHKITVGKSR